LSNRTTAFPLSLHLECVKLAKHGVACSAFSAAMSTSSDRTTGAHRKLAHRDRCAYELTVRVR
jgi:hypothetical protein